MRNETQTKIYGVGVHDGSGDSNRLRGQLSFRKRGTRRIDRQRIEGKKIFGESASNVLSSLNGNTALLKTREILSAATTDAEILEMSLGLEDGYFRSYNSGDRTGTVDPKARPWYQLAKQAGKPAITEPYVDVNTNKLIVAVATPVKANGNFIGATCLGISLDTLNEQAKKMNYHGVGSGIITEQGGTILATSQFGEAGKNFKEISGIGARFDEMHSKGNGYFEIEIDGEDTVFAYATVPATGCAVADVAQDVRCLYRCRLVAGVRHLLDFRGQNHDARRPLGRIRGSNVERQLANERPFR